MPLKRASRGAQEALKVPEFANGPYGFLVFGVDDFWHTLQRFRLLPLQDACLGPRKSCFSYMFPMVSAHGHVGFLGRTSEAAFLCLLFAPLPRALPLRQGHAGAAQLHEKSSKIIALGGRK